MKEKLILKEIKKEVENQHLTTYRLDKLGIKPNSYNRAMKLGRGLTLTSTIKLCDILGLKLTLEKKILR